MKKIDCVTEISLFLTPFFDDPALVVITITPFLPAVPYNVDAAKPFSTLILSMLLGSKSKKRLEPTLPLKKFPWELVSLLNGTPSTTNKAWLLPVIEEYPLITTFVAEPEVPLWDVIWTPDALEIKL